MKNILISFLLGSVLVVLCAEKLMAESNSEDPQESTDRRSIEEVIVTATRVESSAQETAVAVTAFGAREREELGLRTIQEIAAFTPGVSYQSNPNRFTIRGVGRLDNATGSDPGVATYYDGTYTSETAAIGQIPLFIERTEVLRGPQGTLFGRNAVGGLVNVISRRPSDEFSADVQATINDYGQRFYATSITGPFLDHENFQYRLNAWKQNDVDGYQENLGSGGKVGCCPFIGDYVELQLDAQMSDRLYAWLKLNGVKTEGNPALGVLMAPYASEFFQGDIYPWPEYGLADSPGMKDNRTVNVDHDGSVGVRNTNQSVLNVEYSFDELEVRYIYSNAQYDFFYSADFDGTNRAAFDYPLFDPSTGLQYGSVPVSTYLVNYIEENKRYDSHELQFITSNLGKIQFIGGFYYYTERIHQPFHVRAPFEMALYAPLNGLTFGLADELNLEGDIYYQAGFLESEQYAAYGQADIALTDQWNLTIGLRYSTDEKEGVEEQRVVFYNPSLLPFSLDFSKDFNGPTRRSLSNTWNAVSGKIGIDYQISDDSMVYGNFAKGFKSGGMRLGQLEGFDPLVPTGISASVSPFVEGETLYSFEAGFKTDLFEKLLRLNTAVFYYDYNDMQAPVSFIDSGTGLTLQDFINIPKTESYGFEVETTWIASDNFQLVGNYSYMKATVAESLKLVDTAYLVPVETDVNGNSLPKAPQQKLALVGSYYIDTDIGTFTAVANWMYYSEQYATLFERDVYKIDAYALSSARLIYNNPDDSIQAILSVSNLTNEDAPISSLGVSGFRNNFARIEMPGDPRLISLEVTKTFGAPR